MIPLQEDMMKLNTVATKLGFERENEAYYQEKNGYRYFLVSYKMPGAFVALPMIMIVFTQSIDKETLVKIRKNSGAKAFYQDSVVLSNNALLVVAPLKNAAKFNPFMEKLTQTFQTVGLKSLEHCPFCEEIEDTKPRLVKGASVHVHDACVKQYVDRLSHELTVNAGDGYLKSVMLAFVGGFVGLIPSILILFAVGFYSAWLFMLIPFGAFYGYKLGNAPRTKIVLPLIAFIALLFGPGFMFYVYLDLAWYFEVSMALMLTDSEILAAFVSDMVASVLFSLIAIFVSYRYIYNQTNAKVLRDLNDLK